MINTITHIFTKLNSAVEGTDLEAKSIRKKLLLI